MRQSLVLATFLIAALTEGAVATAEQLTDLNSADIQNRKLRVVSFFDGSALVTPKGGLDAIAVFSDGRLEGSLGCGHLMGTYAISGNRMRVSAEQLLRGNCTFYGPHDTVITKALTGDHIVERNGDRIVLCDIQGTIRIVLAP